MSLTLILSASGILIRDGKSSIPVWAKKYKMSCFACHVSIPKLNDFGRRFRANGYQLPGTIEETPIWERKQAPIGLMVHEMYMRTTVENNMGMSDSRGIGAGERLSLDSFENLNIELFSGGQATKHLSYFVLWEVETEREIVNGEVESTVAVEPEQTFVVYNNILDSGFGNLNARVGLFELDLPFSQIRTLSSHSNKYLVYDLSPVDHGFRLGTSQLGLSLNGRYEGLEYEAAIVNGRNDHSDKNNEKDLYLRAAFTTYDPMDFVSDVRIGCFACFGRENLGSNLSEENSSYSRFGIDLSMNLGSGINVFGQWMAGTNDDTDGSTAGDQEFEFKGGFFGVDAVLLPERLIGYFRYDLVDISKQWNVTPATVAMMGNVDDVSKVTAGLRCHFSPSAFAQIEWSRQDNMVGNPGGTNEAGLGMNTDMNMVMLMFAVAF